MRGVSHFDRSSCAYSYIYARAPLAPSPAVLSLCSSARLLLAPLAASTAARFARRWLLRLLLTSLAVYLLDLLAHLNDCPPRLAHLACSIIFFAGAQLKSPLSLSGAVSKELVPLSFFFTGTLSLNPPGELPSGSIQTSLRS